MVFGLSGFSEMPHTAPRSRELHLTSNSPDSLLQPRSGLPGLWDRLIGPGSTPAENSVILITAVLGAACVGLLLALQGNAALLIGVGTLIAFDLFGGAVANATETTKRWYHRPGMTRAHHIGYVAPHLLHVLVVAWLFRDGDWSFFLLSSFLLLVSTLVLLSTAQDLRRPVAVSLYLAAILAWLNLLGPTPGLEWFTPVLFLKLLVGYLVPERPWRIRPA